VPWFPGISSPIPQPQAAKPCVWLLAMFDHCIQAAAASPAHACTTVRLLAWSPRLYNQEAPPCTRTPHQRLTTPSSSSLSARWPRHARIWSPPPCTRTPPVQLAHTHRRKSRHERRPRGKRRMRCNGCCYGNVQYRHKFNFNVLILTPSILANKSCLEQQHGL
jgi:hypothetical protein